MEVKQVDPDIIGQDGFIQTAAKSVFVTTNGQVVIFDPDGKAYLVQPVKTLD